MSASQAEGRGFKSRFPLQEYQQVTAKNAVTCFLFCDPIATALRTYPLYPTSSCDQLATTRCKPPIHYSPPKLLAPRTPRIKTVSRQKCPMPCLDYCHFTQSHSQVSRYFWPVERGNGRNSPYFGRDLRNEMTGKTEWPERQKISASLKFVGNSRRYSHVA